MKQILKSLVAGILALFARAIIEKYKPYVVMITGSVGKTSTKDAVHAVLGASTFVRASEKSYNSEFGVPLTIIGAKNPWNNPIAWLRVFHEALLLLCTNNHFPKTLVLEVGADRPGDLKNILKIATPDAVVVTKLPDVPVHVEAYASPSAVRDEEFLPAYALKSGSPLIISSDDPYAREMASRIQANVVTYGSSPTADVCVSSPHIRFIDDTPVGMEATLTIKGKSYPLQVNGALGIPQLYAPSAAVALAYELSMTEEDILKGVASYVSPAGRGRVLRGIKDSVLVDDTYNASPAAVVEALTNLSLITNRRRVAVLGDMLELGRFSVEEHEKIGALSKEKTDVLITVGIRSRETCKASVAAGMKEDSVHCFDSTKEALKSIRDLIEPRDVVLLKGSQSIRMERLVEALLENPDDTQYLVRQDSEWKSIK